MSKLVASIKEAIEKCELRDGMTISFHHHMRNGDYVLNMVLDEIAKMGIKNLTVNASSIFDVHEPIIGHIKNGRRIVFIDGNDKIRPFHAGHMLDGARNTASQV